MNYLKLQHMDSPVSIFDICQAYLQLEDDYSREGWLQERPSNRRRKESTGCQLMRIGYSDYRRWVDIISDDTQDNAPGDDDVRDIYLINALKHGLPMDDAMRAFIAQRYTLEFLSKFQSWSKK